MPVLGYLDVDPEETTFTFQNAVTKQYEMFTALYCFLPHITHSPLIKEPYVIGFDNGTIVGMYLSELCEISFILAVPLPLKEKSKERPSILIREEYHPEHTVTHHFVRTTGIEEDDFVYVHLNYRDFRSGNLIKKFQ